MITARFDPAELTPAWTAALERLTAADAVRRLWEGDHTVIQDDPTECADRLGWLHSPRDSAAAWPRWALVADEIVDGASAGAGVPPRGSRELLDGLEDETYGAIERGFSSNLVVHAFARTARHAGIGPDLVRPFFASMRADLSEDRHSAASLDVYV